MTSPRKAHVIGLGLIGGSICLALRDQGWMVTGSDADVRCEDQALGRGIIAGTSMDSPEVVFAATPSQYVVEIVKSVLEANASTQMVVTDVAGVKETIVSAIADPRFIGGHPMAGSELKGLEGSRPDLFDGATWVLTPSDDTPPGLYAQLHSIISSLGASPLPLPAVTHDRLVAMASHVPHLVAGALMNEAALMAEEDAALLRLAAGGFRDMTRISAGDPSIWPNVLFDNRLAVVDGLNRIIDRLSRIQEFITDGERASLHEELSRASQARKELPGRAVVGVDLVVVRLPIVDRPGMLAGITTLASNLGVNIFDLSIVHGVEGVSGVLDLSVQRGDADRLESGLIELGLHPIIDQS